MKEVNFNNINRDYMFENNNQVLKIEKDGEDFYIKIHLKKESENLVIFSNGAYDPSKSNLPAFMRSSWHEDFNASCIFIDDKTIHNNKLRIGWGVGTKDRHYIKDYLEISKLFSELLGVSNKNIIYFGSSAGGFMSLLLASHHRGSIAVVNNPQTYVNRYNPISVKKLYSAVFPGMTSQEILKSYRARLSVTRTFGITKNVPKTYYIQNRLCLGDMEKHYKPLCHNMDKYKLNTEKINFILYNNKESGHGPLGRKTTVNYINYILSNQNSLLH